MKMNNSVACRAFFEDQIQYNREGLWCVTLQPNGQILGLIEAKLEPRSQFNIFLKTLRKQLRNPLTKQLQVTRIDRTSVFFNEEDWKLIEVFRTIAKEEEISFCDYLKLNSFQSNSLIQYEFI